MNCFDNHVSIRCTDTPPGACCKPRLGLIPSLRNHRAGSTTFFHLRQNQFGAGWPARANIPHLESVACTGAPILRFHGPTIGLDDSVDTYNPLWGEDVPGTPETVVFAIAWIDLRLRFPPSSAEPRYLQWQGVKGLVWGRNTWKRGVGWYPVSKSEVESADAQCVCAERCGENCDADMMGVSGRL